MARHRTHLRSLLNRKLMSQSISHATLNFPLLRLRAREIHDARNRGDFAKADQVRRAVLAVDSGMRVTVAKSGRVSLWHMPTPPCERQYHYLNYPEFLANSIQPL